MIVLLLLKVVEIDELVNFDEIKLNCSVNDF
jgi:hypothetical protein